MEIIISGRHYEVSNHLKEQIQSRLEKMAQDYHKLTTARVVLETERGWEIVEARINGKHLQFDATARTTDMYLSADEALDKLDKQLRKHQDRLQEHHPRKFEVVESLEEEEEFDEEESFEEELI
jgi:putative sigma-54 modulation protein